MRALTVLVLVVAACGDDDGSIDAGRADTSDSGIDAGMLACAGDAFAALENEVLVELNARRATMTTCGSTTLGPNAPLANDPALRVATRCQAAHMADEGIVTGEDAGGAIFNARATRAGYDRMTTAAAFGAAASDATAAGLVDAVLGSPANCMGLLASDVTDVGIGIATDGSDGAPHYFEIIVGR